MADAGVRKCLDVDIVLLRPLLASFEDVDQVLQGADVDRYAEVVKDRRHGCCSADAKAEDRLCAEVEDRS